MHINLQLNSLKGLAVQQFGSATPTQFKNVAAHSDRGPDGSRITDGVFAPEGHSSGDTTYSYLLAHNANDPRSALVIDLGAPFTVCGDPRNGCHSGPIIQADNDDIYQLDYSTDGVNWTINLGQFPTCCDSGLRTRPLASRSSPYPNFTARYVRVYAFSGGPHFYVSELQLWDTNSNLISVGKHAVGPRPYVIADGVFCEGCSASDSNIAVILNHLTGPVPALVIDLRDSQGNPRPLCGGPSCGATGSGPLIEADNDDVYGFDYSTDGKNWTTYPGTFPTCCSSGERKRSTQGPNFTASYVRVYALSGGATFAVSELQFWDTSGKLISVNAPTYGPEPLVTNGEFAPEGTSSTDSRYAFILPPCLASKGGGGTFASSVCPTASAQTPAFVIDLTATFPISSLVLQADHAQEFRVESSNDGQSWALLATFSGGSGSGLTTRTVEFPGLILGGRYLRVYGTAGSSSNYSISELQVFTPQANTACLFDDGANAGENFACGYDGQFVTELVPTAPNSNGRLPVSFFLKEAQIIIVCENVIGDHQAFEFQSATNRNCTDSLAVSQAPVTDYCAGSCATGNTPGLMSYAQLPDGQFAFDTNNTNPLSISCDGGTIDSSIPGAVHSVVAGVATNAVQGLYNGLLDYHGKPHTLVPFPPTVGACPATTGEPPQPEPPVDNVARLEGRATKVGNGTASATLSIRGRFTVEDPQALDQAVLTIETLIREVDGADELVQSLAAPGLLLPLSLLPRNGSGPDKGNYTTPPGNDLIVQARVAPVKGRDGQSGLMEFSLDVRGATIVSPSRCPAALTTSFQLISPAGEPVWVHGTGIWHCDGAKLETP
jgi:hypothetical protein